MNPPTLASETYSEYKLLLAAHLSQDSRDSVRAAYRHAQRPPICSPDATPRMAERGPAPIVVAVSGPDNVGKSTQIRLLTHRAGLLDVGRLDAYDPRWAGAREAGLGSP